MITHTTTCRVIYGDTDKMGFVYHANYFRWFESARSEMFRYLGVPYKSIESRGFFLPLSEVHCKFNRGFFLPLSEVHCKFNSPSQYDDILRIETSLDTNVKGGMKFDYQIFSEDGKKLLAKGYTKHACVDTNGRVVRPPKFARQNF
ncbi:MAG: acyl-CoA thioesterase [Deltaproteobacteria bacterium]|nr:acyl-CoA thioesterase [Deltaproteobacteria bacterium]